MTLAADGHLVKVHKNIVACVSPFIKALIRSASNNHPIIFLSNISYKVLCYIVEYIYTGEIKVPLDEVQSFLNAAADLHLIGLESYGKTPSSQPTQITQDEVNATHSNNIEATEENLCSLDSNLFSINILNTNAIDVNQVENVSNEYVATTECNKAYTVNSDAIIVQSSDSIKNNAVHNMGNIPDEHTPITVQNTAPTIYRVINEANINAVEENIAINTNSKPQQYSVSIRGSLQIILNHYIYHLHHQAYRGVKRRWRCIDYRRKRCKAYIDTLEEAIIERKNVHNHPHHDSKILYKVQRNQLYESIRSIPKRYQKDGEQSMEEDSS
ncbi:unnamed protein product [Leptidea sinapis]|uniref:BTB domain-containing protein n=1 Tax=Leptidea sinapis TaxID=189913 RepID=A0A5E4PV02_9NEOP|nr:unnamed protein product [Leptidea sinapis]